MAAQKSIVSLGFFFFLLYSADTSCNSIISYIFEELDLPYIGPTSLTVQYLTFIVSLIIAPGVKMKPKQQFLMGSIFHIINYGLAVVASLLSTDSTLVFVLICSGLGIGGFGGGFLWVSQGRYVHIIC